MCRKTWGEPLSPVVFPSGRLHSSHKPRQHPLKSRPVREAREDDVTVACVCDIVIDTFVGETHVECKKLYPSSLNFVLMTNEFIVLNVNVFVHSCLVRCKKKKCKQKTNHWVKINKSAQNQDRCVF